MKLVGYVIDTGSGERSGMACHFGVCIRLALLLLHRTSYSFGQSSLQELAQCLPRRECMRIDHDIRNYALIRESKILLLLYIA